MEKTSRQSFYVKSLHGPGFPSHSLNLSFEQSTFEVKVGCKECGGIEGGLCWYDMIHEETEKCYTTPE